VAKCFSETLFFIESRDDDRDFQVAPYYTILDPQVTNPSR
jgi:hypothetical protein